jgi:hypothetical protein
MNAPKMSLVVQETTSVVLSFPGDTVRATGKAVRYAVAFAPISPENRQTVHSMIADDWRETTLRALTFLGLSVRCTNIDCMTVLPDARGRKLWNFV